MSRCLIVGTSNSVRSDGYRSFLQTLRPDCEIILRGFGGSPSVMVPYILSNTEIGEFGTFIIDTLVNDAGHITYNWADESTCEQSLFESASWLRANERKVILLFMPQTGQSKQRLARRLCERRRQWALDIGVEVVDGYEILEGLQHKYTLSEIHLFDEPNHASWPINLIIAQRLSALISENQKSSLPSTSVWPYRVVPLLKESSQTIERSTSLMSRTYTQMTAPEVISLKFEEPRTLIGISFNAAHSSGILEIHSESGIVSKDFRTEGDDIGDLPRHMVHMVASLTNPPSGRKFDFCVNTNPDTQSLESTQRSRSGEGRNSVEVEAAIFRLSQMPDVKSAQQSPDMTEFKFREGKDLSVDELAIGQAAALAIAMQERPAAATIFRKRFGKGQALWDLKPHQLARILADLGEALGEIDATRRLLRGIAERKPGNRAIEDRLTELNTRARAARNSSSVVSQD